MEENQQLVTIYDKYAEGIFRYIFYKTCHRETAEDLTSLTFLKAMEKWTQFDETKGTPSSWLYGIARNLVTDHYRKKSKWGFVKTIEDVWDLPSQDNVLQDLTQKETEEEIHRALHKISLVQREIIILRLWEDLPYKEISVIVGKSENNCKMLFSRALKKLKTSLGTEILIQLICGAYHFQGVSNERGN